MKTYVVEVGIKTSIRIDASSEEEAGKFARVKVSGLFGQFPKGVFFGCNVHANKISILKNASLSPTGLSQRQSSRF